MESSSKTPTHPCGAENVIRRKKERTVVDKISQNLKNKQNPKQFH